MMCVNCRTANGNGFIVETERPSSSGTGNTGSTTQISYTGGFRVMPNPVQTGTVTVEYPQANSDEVQISIADMQGKKILENDFARNTTNGRFTIDVSRLINGTYTVTLLNNGASVTPKLVVARKEVSRKRFIIHLSQKRFTIWALATRILLPGK